MAEFEGLPYNRRFRPKYFNDYIGNEGMKKSLMTALASDRKPQVIMFTGNSGCGKTSMARLFGKEVSCTNRDPEKGACGVCPNCVAMDEYIATGNTDFLTNIKEVNMSEQTGKNDLASVMDDIYIPAFGDEWKIYIFDECHKASDGLQNAMLKIIEEPPEQVLMIFCTTNPERMLDTFLNRMQMQLSVQKPTIKELASLLRRVCETDSVEYDMKGLEFLANRSERTIRTALQYLWNVVTEQKSAKYEDCTKVFEEVANTLIFDFLKALKKQDIFSFVNILTTIKKKMELSVFMTELKGFIIRGIYIINGLHQEGVSDQEMYLYRSLFSDLAVDEVASLVSRVLSFNSANLELELILWGYSGLVSKQSSQDINELPVSFIEDELVKERDHTNKELKKQADEKYKQGVENAKDLMQSVSFEDLLASFGATEVKM